VANAQVQVEISDQPFVEELQSNQWGFCKQPRVTDWKPGIIGATAEVANRYCKNQDEVSLFIGYYAYQQQGHEAANFMNRLNPPEGDDFTASKVQSQNMQAINVDGQQVDIEAAVVVRHGQVYRVWRWYRIGSTTTGDVIKAKIYEAYAKLLENRGDALFMVLATPIAGSHDVQKADSILQDYTDSIYPLITSLADSLVE